ncbi:olfactory receptor 5F1-like [Microcaecilia unicolor]|uniref:Olfactory receptor n=1 Tax=Microcaecilia unicolor TaxID=1415580 RepID=A0A6P7WPK8_9AMPH|nr:olfactory receptor 5F1-like [Microcaecilia unicolor]
MNKVRVFRDQIPKGLIDQHKHSLLIRLFLPEMKDPLKKKNTMENEFMETVNHSSVTEFWLLGFSEFPELQFPLFTLFSLLYMMAVLGNLLVICIVYANRNLHIPMYFFLSNLSVIDVFSLTITVPKLLAILLTQSNRIPFNECILQMYCFFAFTETEFLLLGVMSYDRYVAICNPLRYSIIMNKRVCDLLAAASWVASLIDSLPHTVVISQFSFCDSNIINHFFCDFTALLKLSCTDTSILDTMTFVEGVVSGFTPFLLTLTSYVFIISTILKIHSREGKNKVFSTCSSHLTVLIMSYGAVLGVYMQPSSGNSMNSNKLPVIIYIVILPLLNPLIYSLRSKELNVALKKAISRRLTWLTTR